MMFIVGILFYIAITTLVIVASGPRDFILQSFSLSPEITSLIAVAYFYPLIVFLVSVVFKNASFSNARYFKIQVTLASTLAVSFGLIGTFIGLAQMIGGIATGLNAEGDFSTKMASLLTAIGTALDSMSLAFLTSILGVGASIVILLSSNFLGTYFAEDDSRKKEEENAGTGGSSLILADDIPIDGNMRLADGFELVKERVEESLDLVAEKEQIWEDLYLLLEKNTGSSLVDGIMETLIKNSKVSMHVANEMTKMRTDQGKMMTQLTQAVGQMNQSLNKMSQQVNANASATQEVISHSTKEMKALSEILSDIRLSTAMPIDEALKKAMREDAFALSFQPQMGADKQLLGCETFIRWEDSIRGVVNNNDLFELAKQNNMLVELDRWIINAAYKQVSIWIKNGQWKQGWKIAINITADQLLDPGTISYLEEMQNTYGFESSNISIDITENVIMNNPEESKDKLRQIHALGIQTNIDGFGSGYSSIRNLKILKIDTLKIGREIVADIVNGDETVLRSIMNIGSELGISVTAEGIETQEGLDILQQAGCVSFQGYFLGRPANAKEFAASYF